MVMTLKSSQFYKTSQTKSWIEEPTATWSTAGYCGKGVFGEAKVGFLRCENLPPKCRLLQGYGTVLSAWLGAGIDSNVLLGVRNRFFSQQQRKITKKHKLGCIIILMGCRSSCMKKARWVPLCLPATKNHQTSEHLKMNPTLRYFPSLTLKLASNHLHPSSWNWCQGSHSKFKRTLIEFLSKLTLTVATSVT